MRTLVGLIILVLGYLGLGFWTSGSFLSGLNFGKNAAEIEQFVSKEAAAKVAGLKGITTSVSGRDITVSGIAGSREEQATIIANLESSDAYRIVRDKTRLLTVASPYVFNGSKSGDDITYTGNTPTKAAFDSLLGSASDDLVVAAGAPDENWIDFVAIGVAGLGALNDAELAVSDKTMTLTGRAASLESRAQVAEMIKNLPDGYSAKLDVDVQPTVPYVFSGTKTPDGIMFTGYIPDEAARSQFEVFAGEGAELTPAFGMPDANWPSAVAIGAGALKQLPAGELTVSGQLVTLTGEAESMVQKAAIEARLAELPDGYSAQTDLSVDPVELYTFNGTKTADGLTFSGYAPDDATRNQFAALIGNEAAKLTLAAGMPDAEWPAVVGAGVNGLKAMSNGTLSIKDRTITLTGTVAGSEQEKKLRDLFSGLPSGYKANLDIKALDDGKPVSLNMKYSDASGGTISGKAPANVDIAKLVNALAIPSLNGAVSKSDLEGGDAITKRFVRIGKFLGRFKSADATVTPSSTIFRGVLKSGQSCNLSVTVSAMMESMDGTNDIKISPSPDEPKPGSTRLNSATGKTETYMNCLWKEQPDIVVEPAIMEPAVQEPQGLDAIEIDATPTEPADNEISLAACQARANATLDGSKINFVTAKAELDAKSTALIERLAVAIQSCVGKGINLEVGGHTDDRGSAAYNAQLSLDRAAAVVEVLVDKGVDANAITAKGYGESSPIASNDTEQGLAANRRTTFTWSTN